MANVLGSLFVELKANTAEFVSGMSKASYAAKQAGRDIEGSFSKLGSLAGSLLAPFGEVGAAIGAAFSNIGVWSGAASGGLAKLAGGMGPLAVAGGTAAAAVAAVEVGAIAMSVHTAEAAARMLVLSQSTGVSVETLSGFSFAAKQSGIDSEVMTTALAKLSKSVFAAAIAAPGATNAFTRLGISVRDSSGNIRETSSIVLDIADKFSKMADGPAKGALAIQLFSRAGYALIPFLNEGREGIQGFLDTAQALGIVLDTQTAEAAHKFQQGLDTISAVGQGLSLHLMKELLPTLQTVVNSFVEWGKELNTQGSTASKFIDEIVWLTKALLVVTETFWTLGAQIGLSFKAAGADVLNFVDQIEEMWAALKHGDFSGIAKAFNEAGEKQKANSQLFMRDSKDLWAHYSDFIHNVMGPRAPWTLAPQKRATFTPDLSREQAESDKHITERIAKLQAEADAQLRLASTVGQSTAAMILAKAAGDADTLTSELHARAVDKNGKPIKQFNDLIDQNVAKILGLESIKASAATAAEYGKKITGETEKLGEQTHGLLELADAYKVGGDAIAAAQIQQKLAEDNKQLATLNELYELLAQTPGVAASALEAFKAAIDGATQAVQAHGAALAGARSAQFIEEIAKTAYAYRELKPFQDDVAHAYLDGADAVRAANVQLEFHKWLLDHPGAGADLQSEAFETMKKESADVYRRSLEQEAVQYDISASYQDTITKVERLREVLQEHGRSTLLADAAIYDANERTIKQWDEAAAKVGTFSERFRGLMNELALEGQNFSGKIFASFHQAIDDLETQLAKFVVTGKANFRQLWQTLEESIVKASLQKAIGTIGGWINKTVFGGAIPGLGPKADGSSASPFYVIPVDSGGNILGKIAGGGGSTGGGLFGLGGGNGDFGGETSGEGGAGGGGIFSSIFGKLGSMFNSIGSVIAKVVSSIGSVFKGIFSLFGGFRAGGGDVSPGKAYIVGEKHPEFFMPKQPGHVAASLEMGNGPQQTIVNFHVHGVQDHDSFRKSRGQIFADLQYQLALAHSRNR